MGALAGGVILIVMGILAFAATIGRSREDTTRNISLLLVSFGSMWPVPQFYLEGRKLRSEYQSPSAPIAMTSKRPFAPCGVCGLPAATFWCTTHSVKICPECLSPHDDPKRCVYKTMARASSPLAQN